MAVAADHPGETSTAPPAPHAPPATATRLPQPLTRFVGREEALAAIGGLLEQHQLVTLSGVGGCGKTRLALELARRMAPDSGLGECIFVDLAPLQSPALVVSALGSAVGVPEGGALPLAEVLHHRLADRRLLVLLDNCEHVVEECARLLSGLLSHCPQVTVLATSREPLGVDGEVTWGVPPLSLPDREAADPVAALSACEAGALFLDRASLAQPGHQLSLAEAAAAVTICHRLDGVPLALELAVSRLRVLDLPQLAAALDDMLTLLDSGPRSAPARQRTLEASIEWSYSLLGEPEKRLFWRLGVFSGLFGVEAAAAVAGGDRHARPSSALALLGRLVDQSMVRVERSSGTARYRLLATMRQFAQVRLVEAGEEEATRDRHLDHFVSLAERFRTAVDAPTEADSTVEAATLHLDDLRSALDWSLASGQITKGLRLATALRWLWVAGGRIQEGRGRLSALLAAAPSPQPAGEADGGAGGDGGAVGDGDEAAAARAGALAASAMLALVSADPLSQRALATEALALARRVGDRAVEGEALVALGWAATFLDPPTAHGLITEGLALLEDTGLDRFVEYGEIGLGVALANEGRLPEAAAAFEAAVDRSRPARSWAAQLALGMLGYVETLQGKLPQAREHLEDGLSGVYSQMFQNQTRQWYGLTLTYQGDYDQAAAVFAAAVDSSRGFGVPLVPGWLHFSLLELACDRPAEAAELVGKVLPFFQVMGWRWFETQARRALGDAAAAAGDEAGAATHWHEAMAAARATDNPLASAVAHTGLARQAVAQGDAARAGALLRTALRAALGSDYQLGAIDALESLAVLAARAPEAGRTPAEAAQLLAAVEAVRSQVGYVPIPSARALFEEATARARDALGAGYAPERAAGAALTLEEATALAFRGESRPPRPPSGWASLTPAELRVVDLVTAGLSNPEIGERLFISRRTVQTHLSRVFAKLGVTNRAELAALASRRA